MNEILDLVYDYIRMVWRHRWIALAVAMVVCMVGWVVVLKLPDSYEVTAKVYVDTRSMLKPLLKGLAADTSRGNVVDMVRRTVLARSNLAALARRTDMDLRVADDQGFEALLERMARQIEITASKNQRDIFAIAYSNEDPNLAVRVVRTLLETVVEKSLGETRKDTSTTKEFLDRQIKSYEAKLVAAEERLKEFRRQHLGEMPGSAGDYFQRSEAMRERMENATLELREAEHRRDELETQLENVDEMFESEVELDPIEMADPIDGRIASLQAQLDQLLLQYTDRHPDVISIRRVIAQLEAEKATAPPLEVDEFDDEPTIGRDQVENPLFQQLKVALGEAEAVVASLKTRVEEFRRRSTELEEQVETALNVEAEFKRLNRDYDLNRRNYNELLKRRETVQLGDEVSQTTENVKFNVLEPPRVPTAPSSPNRPLLSAAVLAGAVAAGVGLAWLLSMFRPAIYTKEGLAAMVQLPVLGVVSRVWTRKERFQRRMEVVTFAFGCLFLVGIFGVLLTLQSMNVDILAKVEQIGRQFL